jgi:hypothetical protein
LGGQAALHHTSHAEDFPVYLIADAQPDTIVNLIHNDFAKIEREFTFAFDGEGASEKALHVSGDAHR